MYLVPLFQYCTYHFLNKTKHKKENFLCHNNLSLLARRKLVENKKCCVCFLFCLVIQRNGLLNSKMTKDLTVNLLFSDKEIVPRIVFFLNQLTRITWLLS